MKFNREDLKSVSDAKDDVSIKFHNLVLKSEKQKQEYNNLTEKMNEINSLYLKTVDSCKKSIEVIKNLKLQNATLDKANENLRNENTKLTIRSAAVFDDLTPRFKNITSTIEEFQLNFDKNKYITSIDFTNLLINSIRSKNTIINEMQNQPKETPQKTNLPILLEKKSIILVDSKQNIQKNVEVKGPSKKKNPSKKDN